MDTSAERDKRLDDLLKATKEWADAEKKRLKYERDFLQSVFKARTSSGKLSNRNVSAVANLALESIKQLLEG